MLHQFNSVRFVQETLSVHYEADDANRYSKFLNFRMIFMFWCEQSSLLKMFFVQIFVAYQYMPSSKPDPGRGGMKLIFSFSLNLEAVEYGNLAP